MKPYQSIVISALALSLVAITGCNLSSTINANTNTAATVNTVTTKNVAVVANKTNTSSDTAEIDTSDWQTYTNEEYGFSLKYPEEWQISKDIFEEYKKSFDNPRYQVNEKDVVFLTALTADEIDSEIYQYQNQTDEMGQGVFESIGKGKLVLIAVSEMAVADLVSQPGFTFTIGESVTLDDDIEVTNVYLEKRWEGNSDYHYVYIPFQSTEKTNMDKQIKSVVVYVETNGGDYDQETLLNITKTFRTNS